MADELEDPAQGSKDHQDGQELDVKAIYPAVNDESKPVGLERDLTETQKIALQIDVGKNLFTPHCFYPNDTEQDKWMVETLSEEEGIAVILSENITREYIPSVH